jgi:hypothetical protein
VLGFVFLCTTGAEALWTWAIAEEKYSDQLDFRKTLQIILAKPPI